MTVIPVSSHQNRNQNSFFLADGTDIVKTHRVPDTSAAHHILPRCPLALSGKPSSEFLDLRPENGFRLTLTNFARD
jgi:hypothetical protein